jgi:flagellar biosynthesis protein FlhF
MMMYSTPPPMEVFTIQAATEQEAYDMARLRYGNRVKVAQRKPVRSGGFFGRLFGIGKEGVEVMFYLPNQTSLPQPVGDLEEEKKKFQTMAPSKQEETLKEMKDMKEVLLGLTEKLNAAAASSARKDAHPSIAKICDLLYENDFSVSYVRRITDRIKKEFSLEELENFEALEDRVVDWIGESISLYNPEKLRKSQVFILVGPTGVGKTTTIAKLAAMYGITPNPLDVRIITIDTFRIGAKEQISKYGEIMLIPVACVNTAQEFKNYLSLYRDVDMILIDTVGKSPRDFANLGEMRELLDAAFKKASVHLALSATTKTMDLIENMQQFESFGYESLVITKLDETPRIGSIVSAAAERGKALSFITDGQKVPQNISAAAIPRLVQRLTGFRIRGEYLEEKFGEKEGAWEE